MSGPTVVEFKRENWRDAATVLRLFLERLESGELAPVIIGCMVIYDDAGALATYGFGPQAEDLQLIAMLELGKTQIMDNVFGD